MTCKLVEFRGNVRAFFPGTKQAVFNDEVSLLSGSP